MSLPAVTVTDNPLSSWASKVNRAHESDKISTSADLRLVRGAKGAHLSLARKHKYGFHGLNYRGDYKYMDDSVASVVDGVPVLNNNPNGTYQDYYDINDVVRVLPENATILLQTGIGATTPFILHAGLWICVAPVPSLRFSNRLTELGLVNAANPSATINLKYLKYIRFNGASYHPVFPAASTIGTFPIFNKYWDLLIPYNQCD